MLEVKFSARFKKEYKLSLKRGSTRAEMEKVIRLLASGNPLPAEYHDHALQGKWKDHRDCHIRPDWVLIYKINKSELVLELCRTGTHSDLFGK